MMMMMMMMMGTTLSWQPGSSTAAEAVQSTAEWRLMFGGGAENVDDLMTHSFMILTASFHNDGFYTHTHTHRQTDRHTHSRLVMYSSSNYY